MEKKDKSRSALLNANKIGGVDVPPCIGVKSNALPKVQMPFLAENSDTGVSTRCALISKKRWYAMRTTYCREQKAYDIIVSKGINAFLPTIIQVKIQNGNKVKKRVSRIPNVFFIYTTEEIAKALVLDKKELSFLRFYCRKRREGIKIIYDPIIVPDKQMKSLMILCRAEGQDVRIVPDEMIEKFDKGDLVIIQEGYFKGIEGKVARWHGQQRVAITIEGLFTISTAYIPSAYLKRIKLT